jgi:hypothetical protein
MREYPARSAAETFYAARSPRIFSKTPPKVQESSNLLLSAVHVRRAQIQVFIDFQTFGSWRYNNLGGTQLFSLIVVTQRTDQHRSARLTGKLRFYQITIKKLNCNSASLLCGAALPYNKTQLATIAP